jgi:hypothetical protein
MTFTDRPVWADAVASDMIHRQPVKVTGRCALGRFLTWWLAGYAAGYAGVQDIFTGVDGGL